MTTFRFRRSHRVGPGPQIVFWLWCSVTTLAFFPFQAGAVDEPVRYLLDLRDPGSHVIHVTMTVPQAAARTEIQFPTWNNLYQIRDFVRNVQELEARCDRAPERLSRVDLNTWQSAPQTCSQLEVRYAVYANEESIFATILNEQHAFLNFALLLFYLPQDRQRETRLKFLLPEGWKLATALEEDSGEFKASNYDSLVDSPAEAGNFHEYRYTQGSATYRVIVYADLVDYPADKLLTTIRKITAFETGLMGEVPFSRYTFFLHFPRSGWGGAMEHRYGTAIRVPAADLSRGWDHLEATLAHEFFHLWNVKRIRPKALEPIDYVRGNDTRDLWFAEGVTSYYQELVLLRTGMISRQHLYERLAEEIQRLQERPARHFQNLEDAGREAWLEKYPDYLRAERSISYYNKGILLGWLLDLAIRHATRNHQSLDDLMRRLNQDFAHRGRFYTEQDLRALVRELAPNFKEATDFFSEYLSGTGELDYETYLDLAGLRLQTTRRESPSLGFQAVQNFDGPIQVASVDSDSNAQEAGVERGDILLKINGQPLTALPEAYLVGMRPGQRVKFQLSRGNRVLDIDYALGRRVQTEYRVREIARATPEQLQVRKGWLEGKTGQ